MHCILRNCMWGIRRCRFEFPFFSSADSYSFPPLHLRFLGDCGWLQESHVDASFLLQQHYSLVYSVKATVDVFLMVGIKNTTNITEYYQQQSTQCTLLVAQPSQISYTIPKQVTQITVHSAVYQQELVCEKIKSPQRSWVESYQVILCVCLYYMHKRKVTISTSSQQAKANCSHQLIISPMPVEYNIISKIAIVYTSIQHVRM